MTKEKAQAFEVIFGGDVQAVEKDNGEWAIHSTDAFIITDEVEAVRQLADEHDLI